MSDKSSPTHSRASSPAGSECSAVSLGTRKRERPADEHDDRIKPPTKRPPTTKQTMSDIIDFLKDVKITQSQHGTILEEIPPMRTTINTVCADATALKAATDRLTTVTEALTTKTEQLAAENCQLSADNRQLKASLAKLEARFDQLADERAPGPSKNLSRLEAATNSSTLHVQRTLARNTTNNEISISGFSFAEVTTAALLRLCAAIAVAIDYKAEPGDFMDARLLRKKPTVDEAESTALRSTKTLFAVVCASPGIAQRMISAKTKFGNLKFSQLNQRLLADVDLPEPHVDFQIHVGELLPSHVLRLLKDAKAALKEVGFKYVWCKHGPIYAKKDNDMLVHTINSHSDLPRLTALYVNPDQ